MVISICSNLYLVLGCSSGTLSLRIHRTHRAEDTSYQVHRKKAVGREQLAVKETVGVTDFKLISQRAAGVEVGCKVARRCATAVSRLKQI